MKVLVIDVGGTHVKILATGETEPRKFVSGPKLTAARMVSGVKKLARDWKYDVVSIGFPGPVLQDRPIAEPHNLGRGWVGFKFKAAFGRPVKIVNDAAMQALGSYKGGKMLFLGLGTGLGTAMIVDGILQPMELGHLPYKKGTYETYVGAQGLQRWGKKKWRRHVVEVVGCLVAALQPEDVVLGGGNIHKLKELPPNCRAGDNANAFLGGFRLWDKSGNEKNEKTKRQATSKSKTRHGGTKARKKPKSKRASAKSHQSPAEPALSAAEVTHENIPPLQPQAKDKDDPQEKDLLFIDSGET